MEIKTEGQLRHRFHGDYSAVIALSFESEKAASLALPLLPNWHHGEKNKSILVWVGDSDALKGVKTLLGKFGADERKIDSLAKSVDYGERFSCTFQVNDPNQLNLF